MKTAIFAIVPNLVQAETVVDQLKLSGFTNDDISVLFPDAEGTKDFAHANSTKAPEGAITGAATAGVLGGLAGWLVGIGTLAIPGVGPFIAAGPILAALSGAAIGATAGGVVGALVGFGIPEYEAKLYAGKLHDGNILIAAHAETSEQVKTAKELFRRAEAHDIGTSSEVSAPKI